MPLHDVHTKVLKSRQIYCGIFTYVVISMNPLRIGKISTHHLTAIKTSLVRSIASLEFTKLFDPLVILFFLIDYSWHFQFYLSRLKVDTKPKIKALRKRVSSQV